LVLRCLRSAGIRRHYRCRNTALPISALAPGASWTANATMSKMSRPILERERELAEIGAAAREARGGEGSIVLIVGEAGIGKSSLVNAVRSVLPAEGRVLMGYCDDLATPRVLGPLRDLIGSVGTTLTQALESGDRGQVIDALRAELDWPEHPTVLVVEDVHWADEATLDVLRFLVRRISHLPVVLMLTYRDDELTRDHPLQQLLGLASGSPRLRRLRLARLSAEAVHELGVDSTLDTDQVFAVTAGNPFFVAEVLASGDVGGVPATIAEAVRARLSSLDGPTRDALELLAVVPSAVERWLVQAVVPGGLAALAAAERRGVLTVSPNRVAFRHELARRAIVDSMPAVQRMACNQAVLAALLDRHSGPDPVDLSRILHHATEVGDDDVVIRYGPAAALEAVAAGSHREAVAHYRLVLDHRAAFPPGEQADLLEGYAVECYTLGLADLAVAAQEDAVQLRRGIGDPRALGVGLRWLSRIYWWAGARPAAEASAAEAIEILDGPGDQHALALALSNQSQLYALAGRRRESISVGERAVAMAREIGDPGLLSHALNNVGFAYWDEGDASGRALLAESLAVALEAHEVEHACRAYVNIVWHLIDELRLDEAGRLLVEAIELAEEAEFLGFLRYMHVSQGMLYLARGAWDEAEREAAWAVDAQLTMRCPALVVLGRVRIRRGQDGGDELLSQAWEIAKQLGEAQRLGPAASALVEAAWLRGDTAGALSAVAPVYEEVRRFGHGPLGAELGYWMWTAGAPMPMDESEHPYALQSAGRWREAADAWQRAGCPYEHATALAQSPDPSDLLTALATLDALGAEPLARRVRLRLKELGVTRVPRGPVPSTRDNPAGLTDRQVDVVRLLADGLSNAEIAARLVLSVRTVDTHVGAVLDKLNARTRRDAAKRARALGLVER
jgi:DNA-binding CsgD family transcriptional regulator/tetratricopeptide (TPR) repeat protein/energy-coupling factor transporter ATP-binding protein EcfA2